MVLAFARHADVRRSARLQNCPEGKEANRASSRNFSVPYLQCPLATLGLPRNFPSQGAQNAQGQDSSAANLLAITVTGWKEHAGTEHLSQLVAEAWT